MSEQDPGYGIEISSSWYKYPFLNVFFENNRLISAEDKSDKQNRIIAGQSV